VTEDIDTRAETGWSLRLGGVAGIAFVVLTVLGGLVQGNVPVYSDGPAEIKQWFADNSGRYLAGYYLILLGVLFYLVFLAALVDLLMRAAGASRTWPLLALVAGLLVPVAAEVSSGFDGTLALLEGDVSDEVARALSAADYYTFSAMTAMAGVFTLAVSVVILRFGVLWRPLAWIGLLVTLGGVTGGAIPLEQDPGILYVVSYLSLFAFLAWVASVAVVMLLALPLTQGRS
jgi:hypothetical protein